MAAQTKETKTDLKLSVKFTEGKQVFSGFLLEATDEGLYAFAKALRYVAAHPIEEVTKIEESEIESL